jgi:hypothetical protein
MDSKSTSLAIKNRTFWKMHYQQFLLSNLSKTEYAQKHQLVKHRLIYWVKKFEAAAKASPNLHDGFIPVTIKPTLPVLDKNMPVLCTLQLSDNKQLLIHSEIALKLCLDRWR